MLRGIKTVQLVSRSIHSTTVSHVSSSLKKPKFLKKAEKKTNLLSDIVKNRLAEIEKKSNSEANKATLTLDNEKSNISINKSTNEKISNTPATSTKSVQQEKSNIHSKKKSATPEKAKVEKKNNTKDSSSVIVESSEKVNQKKNKPEILRKPKKPDLSKAKLKPAKAKKSPHKLDIPTFLSVTNFATILRVRVPQLINKLEELGFENITNEYILDAETAELVAMEYGFEVNRDDNLGADIFPIPLSDNPAKLKPRAPIVTIMGHVDHGKTTILDFLRKSSIVKGEFGGITQHIGAFVVQTPVSKKKITFLDTPGHAAFLKMRERGANMTDIVILVVAAEDSVKPQTIEAIKHAKNAGVPVIVAINKCDKETANPDKVVADLSSQGIDVEDYGGETPTVRVSAKTGMGMKDLEETVVTVADLLELKSEEKMCQTEGWVLESQVKKGLGNVATFLVKKGELKPGSIIVAGTTWCKVRVMKDEHGKPLKIAKPSQPVEISGWKELPDAGEVGLQAKDESFAKKVIANRERRKRMMEEAEQVDLMNQQRVKIIRDSQREERISELQLQGFTMEDIKDLEPELFDEDTNKMKKVNFIIKADVSGSCEAVKQSISGLGNEEVSSHVLFEEVGSPTETDINRAKDANAVVLAFNVTVPKDIKTFAGKQGVHIKEFNVIYHLIEDVMEELTSQLPPIYETKVTAKVEIKELFNITLKNKKIMTIAGSRVVDGTFKKNSDVRLIRNNEVIYKGSIKQLKVAKDDVLEVSNGNDCGISLEDGPDIQPGDIIESVEKIPIKRHL